jgi:hypothetical protein
MSLMHDLVYGGVPLQPMRRHHRYLPLSRLFGWRNKAKKPPTMVSRDDRSVRELEAAFEALPERSRAELRQRLMQVVITFERTNDIAPVVDFVQSVLIITRLNGNPMYRSSLEEAEAESWDEPGVEIGAAIEDARERRKSAAWGPARQADEQERGTLL